ncbi:Protein of unknown function (DUF1653) [Thermus oshimai JL-2]|uniref:DUF1653 domain-containing protein n=1 Tax=Thermus oshimai JL-2 TaxID=751945 RepID=K7QY53_THEOS|nr:DUF1653 domain-containing protein [Thermus oshimai]AFV76843.1 Protein of unknown function (DUF1653) [Thermus oshimai JL-2]
MWGLRPGVYRHYKGGLYRVLFLARHSETEEEMVVYQALYGEKGYWVRPLALFLAPVWVEGRAVPRFQWVGEGPFHPGV